MGKLFKDQNSDFISTHEEALDPFFCPIGGELMHYPVFLAGVGIHVCLISLIKSQQKDELNEKYIYINPYTRDTLTSVAVDEKMQVRVDSLKYCIKNSDHAGLIEKINDFKAQDEKISDFKAQEVQPVRFLKRIVGAFACCISICRRSRYRVDVEPA